MKLIVGLGNPGKKYAGTRHNVGFVVLDKLAQGLGIKNYELSKKANALYAWTKIGDEKIELLKPQTFMNDSGKAVVYVRNKHKELSTKDICVVHDDLDIETPGTKLQFAKGPKDHNGILSIEKELGTKDFWRMRIGVDTDFGHRTMSGEKYVLQQIEKLDKPEINKAVKKAVFELRELLENWP